jgi:hypothetical protein
MNSNMQYPCLYLSFYFLITYCISCFTSLSISYNWTFCPIAGTVILESIWGGWIGREITDGAVVFESCIWDDSTGCGIINGVVVFESCIWGGSIGRGIIDGGIVGTNSWISFEQAWVLTN